MTSGTTPDDRPTVWTGHIAVPCRDPAASAPFYRAIGMREIGVYDEVAIFELRGGTHLVVHKEPEAHGGPAPWDLMVDDVTATHADWSAKGLAVSAIERGPIHEHFTVSDPDGNTIVVNSSHVSGPV
jgi:catechol 2,3-dioxygenase-like lactoylglutathione lyase family enzyme